jgi:hypothetical protein
MLEQISVNIFAHFKFFRRNRLLLAFSLVILGLMALSSLPAFFLMSKTGHFEVIKALFMELNGFAMVFTVVLGLFLVSSHLRGRNIKMVLTKPCLPEIWLLSGFLASALVSIAIYMVILVLMILFSHFSGLGVYPGYFFITATSFITAMIFMGYLIFLSMVMHPVLAVIVLLFFNEGTFFSLRTFVLMASSANGPGGFTALLLKLLGFIYMILPMTSPMSGNSASVYETMRVTGADWISLFNAFGYMLCISALFYFMSDFLLKRKRLI